MQRLGQFYNWSLGMWMSLHAERRFAAVVDADRKEQFVLVRKGIN
tara:strand:+ start:981 stop:1115 length:135 start_codon:yes stop_codon:yes gene_type:complete